MSRRIQRQRTKGWRMPVGAVYVGRPTEWGNPARIGECCDCWWGPHDGEHRPMTAADVVDDYRITWEAMVFAEANIVYGHPVDLFEEIRGHDLACWCPLDQPCHADVLLELASLPLPVKTGAT